jgi:hypothetical protein
MPHKQQLQPSWADTLPPAKFSGKRLRHVEAFNGGTVGIVDAEIDVTLQRLNASTERDAQLAFRIFALKFFYA